MEAMERSLQGLWDSLSHTPTGHPDRANRFKELGDAYAERYERRGALEDAEKSIELYQEALRLTATDDPDRAGRLQDLGSVYLDKSERMGEDDDLEKSIDLYEQALDLTSEDHPGRPQLLENMGRACQNKYERTDSETDLEEAISYLQIALDTTPKDDPERSERLHSLGAAFGTKYKRTGAAGDLDQASRYLQETADTMPADHPDKAELLQNLGIIYHDQYQLAGSMVYLERATQLDEDALDLTSMDDPYRAHILESLAIDYREKYLGTGEIVHLERSIHRRQEAVDATPSDHPDYPDRLQSLARGYSDQFGRTGLPMHIEKSIEIYKQALGRTSLDSKDRKYRLQGLGHSYLARYRRSGAMADLELSIQCFSDALDMMPKQHRDRADMLQDLAMGYGDKYQRNLEIENLDRAIQLDQEALDLTPADRVPDRTHRLQALGSDLRDRFHRTGDLKDLKKAIQMFHEALDATPLGHVTKAARFKALAFGYRDSYRSTKDEHDIEKSVECFKEALQMADPHHPSYSDHLNNVGLAYTEMHERTGSTETRSLAIEHFQRAANHAISPTRDRLRSGMALVDLYAAAENWEDAYQAASSTAPLIPLLNPRALEASDKQHHLLDVVNFASRAAAIALHAGKAAFDAIQLIELGRGVMAASLIDLRTSVPELQQQHPDLANEYTSLCRQLDSPMKENQPRMDQRYEADQKLQTLIQHIRDKPGFENFLLAPSEHDLKAAAQSGPIVIVNVSELRCDALIIEQSRVWSIQLTELRIVDIQRRSAESVTLDVLDWLWVALAMPVLDTLGIKEPPVQDCWPHIWWVPTGPLCKFPIHAAACLSKSSQNVLDRAISSYNISVKTILHSRRSLHGLGLQTPTSRVGFPKVVLVGMSRTPMQRDLQFAVDEIDQLEELCQTAQLLVSRPPPTHGDVIESLRDCAIFHFAGHGMTDPRNPARSSLLLKDWRDSPLMVSDLLDMNLHSHNPFLAYLSACGTGRVKNDDFLDEGLHLINACQLVGFQHVIGTLWEVDDSSCVSMAVETYKSIIHGGLNNASVSEALHRASRNLRSRWVQENTARGAFKDSPVFDVGQSRRAAKRAKVSQAMPSDMRDIEVCEDETLTSLHWVPYVHYGP